MSLEDGEAKSPLLSKTVHFNWSSAVLVHAIWPFLPHHFTAQSYALSAVTAWFTVGNVIIRFFTREAISIFGGKNV